MERCRGSRRLLQGDRTMTTALPIAIITSLLLTLVTTPTVARQDDRSVRVDLTVRITGDDLPSLNGVKILLYTPNGRKLVWIGHDQSGVVRDFVVRSLDDRIGTTFPTVEDLPDPSQADHFPDGTPIPKLRGGYVFLDPVGAVYPDRTLGWRADRALNRVPWVVATPKRTGANTAEITLLAAITVRVRLMVPRNPPGEGRTIGALRGQNAYGGRPDADGSYLLELPRGIDNLLWYFDDNWIYEIPLPPEATAHDTRIEPLPVRTGERVSMEKFELRDARIDPATGRVVGGILWDACQSIKAFPLDGRGGQSIGTPRVIYDENSNGASDRVVWANGRIGATYRGFPNEQPSYSSVWTGRFIVLETLFPWRDDSFESTWTILQALRDGFDPSVLDLPIVTITKDGAPPLTLDAPKLRDAMDAAARWIKACRKADASGAPRPAPPVKDPAAAPATKPGTPATTKPK